MNPVNAAPARRAGGLLAAVLSLAAGLSLTSVPHAAAAPHGDDVTRQVLLDGSTLVSAPLVALGPGREFSPAGCRIEYVDNPHFSRWVPGAIKVNAKVQCNATVESLSLGVNMTNTTTRKRAAGPKNVTKDGVPYVENFDTWVSCTDARLFQFQGNVGAVSIENGRSYANLAFGNVSRPLPCGYDGA